jgi:hypothetical protein
MWLGAAELPSRATLPLIQTVWPESRLDAVPPATEAGLNSICAFELNEKRRTGKTATYENFMVFPLQKFCKLGCGEAGWRRFAEH